MIIRFNRSGTAALSMTALAIAASALLTACAGHGGSASSVLPTNGTQSVSKSNPNPNTVTNIYSGGSSLASLLYRQWDDYYGVALPPAPQGAPNGKPINANAQFYYASIGSGGGRAAFLSQIPSTITPTVPPEYCANGGTSCYPYPVPWQFAGSDANLSSTEISCYQVGCSPTYPNPVQPQRGQYIQIPSFETDITVPYNPAGQTVPTKGLALSRNSYCGIWEGAITNWGDPSITSDNGGHQVSTQPIVRVVRSDSSGTTFLFTNHLNTACQNLANPAYDWTGGVGGTVTWPGGTVQSGNGSNGVVSLVTSTSGAIGYVGPSFVAPVIAGGLPTSRLQDQYNYLHNSATFTTQSVTTTLNAMHGVAVPSNTNPWDLAVLVPDPAAIGAYPIVGFTWLDIYQCYKTYAEASAVKGLVRWYAQTGTTGTTPPDVILEAQGVAPLNGAFKKAVRGIAPNIVRGPISNTCTI